MTAKLKQEPELYTNSSHLLVRCLIEPGLHTDISLLLEVPIRDNIVMLHVSTTLFNKSCN